jgi:bifunctional DNA-binding transcriptional regulator/antitoxin component of YhaV-PrlF toxin-antitoxin module
MLRYTMKVADEVWTSVALLHKENPERADFSVEEIKARAKRENWPIRPGFNVHASYHCIANKPANPANHRMLYEDSRGRKRLYRSEDPCHPERENGKIHPEKQDLLIAYQSLVDWYDAVYSKQSSPAASAPLSSDTERPLPQESGSAKLPPAPVRETESRSGTAFVSSAGAFVIPGHLREELGIGEGTRLSIHREQDSLVLRSITDELIRSLRGRYKGTPSMVEDREREHRVEKDRLIR